MKFATKFVNITRLILGILLHYLGKLKIQIFCRYSADTEENVNSCILCAQLLISLRVLLCMLSVFMCFYQNLVLVIGYNVDC